MKLALFLCTTLASMNLAVAQTPPQPSTNPSSASSPHQRDTTSTPTKETEAVTPSNPDPAAASTPHQKQVTEGADMNKAKHDKMMADCTAKQQSMNSSMSKDQATKACKEQMKDKMRSEQQPK